jgi:hypothetical protein
VNRRQLARDLHEIWERAHRIHFQASESLRRRPPREPYQRLALEMALHDLLALAARAEALANFAEAATARRRQRGSR